MSYCVGCATCARSPECPRALKAGFLDRQTQRVLGYVGTALFMLGALVVSMNATWSALPWPFAAFLAGHMIWFAIAWCMHEKPLMAMNGLYAVFDVWAVAVRL